MNKALFNKELKSNAGVFWIILVIMAVYSVMITYMYEPALTKILNQYQTNMGGLFNAFGMSGSVNSLTTFLGVYLYGFILVVLPLIFSMIVANRLIVKYIDEGTMDYLLSGINGRFSIVFTQAVYMIMCLFLMILIITVLQVVVTLFAFPGELDFAGFIVLNFGLLCLEIFLASISFFASCISTETRKASILGAGLPIVILILHMLSKSGSILKSIDRYSPMNLFDIGGLLKLDGGAIQSSLILLAAGIVIYLISMLLFCKRNINI